jgi:ChrR Cupin-like domain
MRKQPSPEPVAVVIDSIERVEKGAGCYRRSLPAVGPVSAWVVDMDPGSEWPYVDHHDEMGEQVYIASGELIEGERRYQAGQYIVFGPNSSHRPRTDTGVRLIGFNLLGRLLR